MNYPPNFLVIPECFYRESSLCTCPCFCLLSFPNASIGNLVLAFAYVFVLAFASVFAFFCHLSSVFSPLYRGNPAFCLCPCHPRAFRHSRAPSFLFSVIPECLNRESIAFFPSFPSVLIGNPALALVLAFAFLCLLSSVSCSVIPECLNRGSSLCPCLCLSLSSVFCPLSSVLCLLSH